MRTSLITFSKAKSSWFRINKIKKQSDFPPCLWESNKSQATVIPFPHTETSVGWGEEFWKESCLVELGVRDAQLRYEWKL